MDLYHFGITGFQVMGFGVCADEFMEFEVMGLMELIELIGFRIMSFEVMGFGVCSNRF